MTTMEVQNIKRKVGGVLQYSVLAKTDHLCTKLIKYYDQMCLD